LGASRGGYQIMQQIRNVLRALPVALLFVLHANAATEFLPPEKAFPVEVHWQENAKQLEVHFAPVKGYYLYKESLHFSLTSGEGQAMVSKPILPVGTEKFDETFQKTVQIYRQPFTAYLEIGAKDKQVINAEVELQGCAEAGICYPPMTLKFLISAPGVTVGPLPEIPESSVENSKSAIGKKGMLDLWHERDDIHAINEFLEATSSAYLFVAFFILGLALAFTPCVLPMLPILSSVIFGTQNGQPISKRRASTLAGAYVLGMALVYALAGVLMAAIGSSVQRVLQSPIALLSFALLLIILSGSLFGFYHLRLPHSWHQHVDRLAGRQRGGSLFGAFALGGISTLVASPCITAPLAGVLTFIAQTGSISLGAGLLFVMALGMGLPLLCIAVEARILIPSTGAWMIWLQRVLGVLLVATAFWIASPLFSQHAAVIRDSGAEGEISRQIGPNLTFTVIGSNQQLNAYLTKAKEENKRVLLDFYADWCISCKEMESSTFANLAVSKELEQFMLLQADVSKNTAENQELLKRFGLYGPPGILLFDQNSQEEKDRRVVGYMPPERFLERLQSSNQQ